jgi:hypothetical protein
MTGLRAALLVAAMSAASLGAGTATAEERVCRGQIGARTGTTCAFPTAHRAGSAARKSKAP